MRVLLLFLPLLHVSGHQESNTHSFALFWQSWWHTRVRNRRWRLIKTFKHTNIIIILMWFRFHQFFYFLAHLTCWFMDRTEHVLFQLLFFCRNSLRNSWVRIVCTSWLSKLNCLVRNIQSHWQLSWFPVHILVDKGIDVQLLCYRNQVWCVFFYCRVSKKLSIIVNYCSLAIVTGTYVAGGVC